VNRLNKLISLASLAMVVASACTTVPEQLKGEYSTLRPMDVSEQSLETQVRWAGVIFEIRPQEDHTCFAVHARPIEKSMRPQSTKQSDGRFIACKSGYLDPEDLKVESDVTLTGRISNIGKREIENNDDLIPIVEVDSIILWPARPGSGGPAGRDIGAYNPLYYVVPAQPR
jgi:outer membrane lipoprotein